MNIEDWKSQIKRGTLEFCVLAMIKQRPSYGYEMISTLEKYPILAAKRIRFIRCSTVNERGIYLLVLAGEF